jgi:predicted nucleic acid-binding protein
LREIVCNTSPIQYLHQLGLLHILKALAGQVIIPPAVVDELAMGHRLGIDLPDLKVLEWVKVRRPASAPVLPLVTYLEPGETEVLALLALETPDAVVVLDDALARQTAEVLKIRLTGTLGLLLDAKRKGLIPMVASFLTKLHALGFRIAPHTRTVVLKLAEEADS